jgi:hypothetical protein
MDSRFRGNDDILLSPGSLLKFTVDGPLNCAGAMHVFRREYRCINLLKFACDCACAP